jgi:hypothetical protein
VAAASGARLCYGEPVHVDGRTVIPVARVRALGGAGRGGPGGGGLDAEPLGFIDVSAGGARCEAVPTPPRTARRTAPGLVVVAAAGAMAAAVLGRGRRPRLRALPR